MNGKLKSIIQGTIHLIAQRTQGIGHGKESVLGEKIMAKRAERHKIGMIHPLAIVEVTALTNITLILEMLRTRQ